MCERGFQYVTFEINMANCISAISDFWLHWNTPFILWTLFFVSAYRIISVYGLTWLLNKIRLEPIGYVDQFVMAYGGLRGRIAFSLAKLTSMNQVPQVKAMLCATLVVVFFTSFVQGATIAPFFEWLHVEQEDQHAKQIGEEVVYRALDHVTSGVEDIIGHPGRHWWHT